MEKLRNEAQIRSLSTEILTEIFSGKICEWGSTFFEVFEPAYDDLVRYQSVCRK